jgi:outer membrane protein
MNKKRVLVAAVSAALAAPAAFAQGEGIVGLGAAYVPDYEGSDDYKATPAPFGRYQWASGRFVTLGGGYDTAKAARLKANLIAQPPGGGWQFGPVLQYRLKRDDDVDDDRVQDMRERDAATELGAFVAYKSGAWRLQFLGAGDVSNEYDGYILELSGTYVQRVSDRFTLTYAAGTVYGDSNFMNEYFGVSGRDASRSGLPQYDADSGIKNAMFSLSANYDLTESWGVMGTAGYSRLFGDAEDSPLVNDRGDENQYVGLLAVTYKF